MVDFWASWNKRLCLYKPQQLNPLITISQQYCMRYIYKDNNNMSLIKPNMIILFFFIIFLLNSSSSSNAAVQDFCVGDLTAPEGPAGYSCKKASVVTSNDFFYKDIFKSNQNFPPINLSLTYLFSQQFPGLNGLGMSLLSIQMGPGGIVPAHTHPRANEVIVCIEGTVYAGFISTDNKAYTKTIQAGDVFIFPQGLLHFQLNVGKGQAKVLAFFGGSSPGIQTLAFSLFGNDLPSDVVGNVTFLDNNVVKKLKARFGGTN